MQFKVNEYIFYGTDGICRIDDICENPFEGAPAGVCYYVMHTISEPRQTIWNPVLNDRIPMRTLMREEDISALLREIKTLAPFSAPSTKLLREEYLGAIKGGIPTEWGRVLITYLSRSAVNDGTVRVTDAEHGFFESAKALLSAEIALVCGIERQEADALIDSHVK